MNQDFPITNFPNSLRFDGGLTCGILINNSDLIRGPLPPGNRMSIQHDNAPAHGAIKNMPIPVSPILKCVTSPSTEHSDNDFISSDTQESCLYVILLYSETTVKKLYDDLIQASGDDAPPFKLPINTVALKGIPHFLHHDSKVTMEHKG